MSGLCQTQRCVLAPIANSPGGCKAFSPAPRPPSPPIAIVGELHRLLSDADRPLGRAAGNGHRVLERLYEQPILSVKDVERLLGTTFAGANQIVQRLTDLGILVELTGQARHRRFRYDGHMGQFDERSERATTGR